MKRVISLLVALVIGLFLPSVFAETPGSDPSSRGHITQGKILELALKPLGLAFFFPAAASPEDQQRIFEMKKSVLTRANYPVFEAIRQEEPADCCFLAEVVYQVSTPLENRQPLSCEGIINSLQAKGYNLTCTVGEGIAPAAAVSLFQDPRFMRDVMGAVNPVDTSPYSTALSEAYSTPASPSR
jgi:hypothetical protein